MERIYLHGRSRSGTTITQRILNSHSDIQIFNEKNLYTNTYTIDEILDIEKNHYDGNAKYFGDKRGTPSIEQFNLLSELNIKYIYIYRDGRDSVASAFRINSFSKPGKAAWRSTDPRINSKDWADHYFIWEEAKANIIPDGNWCELRFEDYINAPLKNSTIMSKFLGVDLDEMIKLEKRFIKSRETHKGHFTQWVPDWEETFHQEAIEVLKKLEYLGYI